MPWTAVMGKWKSGKLKSSSGKPVKNQKQAVAIMLSEQRAAKDNPEYRPKNFAHASKSKG